ncbi:MAG: 50S ribosomal protein L4 [Nanoarchaeota archaeon]|jgi:large subunit ribosomal protein L4e|nr:50S ribosomal protein L4 [Nanoarchaeota archaeon]
MKAKLLDITGKSTKQIALPECFNEALRSDLIQKIIEAKKTKQPYAPSPVAGNQASASGQLKHHRKVWKSQYGRGMSRVPRKTMSRKGSQFQWVAAAAPNTRDGRRAHPPRAISMMSSARINKKELKLALMSALSATVNATVVTKRYARLSDKKVDSLPLVVESKFTKLKAKEMMASLKSILGEALFDIAVKQKSVRKGLGRMRGRKYKSTAGLLLVIGSEEAVKTKSFSVQTVKKLGVNDLANGGPGRLTLYTESAIKDLTEKFK